MSYPNLAALRIAEPLLGNLVKFPDALVQPHLDQAIADVELCCERSFEPTQRTESHAVTRFEVRLDRGTPKHREGSLTGPSSGVVSCTRQSSIGTTAVTAAWIDGAGVLTNHGAAPGEIVTVTYWTGLAACPSPISALIMRLARHYATRVVSGAQERTERFSVAADGTRLIYGRPWVRELGLPDLDGMLSRWSLHHGLR